MGSVPFVDRLMVLIRGNMLHSLPLFYLSMSSFKTRRTKTDCRRNWTSLSRWRSCQRPQWETNSSTVTVKRTHFSRHAIISMQHVRSRSDYLYVDSLVTVIDAAHAHSYAPMSLSLGEPRFPFVCLVCVVVAASSSCTYSLTYRIQASTQTLFFFLYPALSTFLQ
jgi:hypothetical protein